MAKHRACIRVLMGGADKVTHRIAEVLCCSTVCLPRRELCGHTLISSPPGPNN